MTSACAQVKQNINDNGGTELVLLAASIFQMLEVGGDSGCILVNSCVDIIDWYVKQIENNFVIRSIIDLRDSITEAFGDDG